MKQINGFISNSSSSSFIIGVGKITDKKKFEDFCNANEIDNSNIEVLKTSEILSGKSWGYNIRRTDDSEKVIVVDSFNGDEVSLKFDPSLEEEFIVVTMVGDEGDYTFNKGGDDDWDPDYDIDSSFFDDRDAKLLEFGKDSGISDYQCSYGAGRNG